MYNLSRKEYESLEDLGTLDNAYGTEAEMFLLRINSTLKVLKKYWFTDSNNLDNKIYTVEELIKLKPIINMEELVIPDSLVSLGNNVIGHIMPYINNVTLYQILESSTYPVYKKMKYLKEVGEILARIASFRKQSKTEFYLGDVHEKNFVFNKVTGKMNVVDTDSCKINGNYDACSRYLSRNSSIMGVSKYKRSDSPTGAYFKVDENTEIYSYIVMLFNYLAGRNINKMSIKEFYDYLDYLNNLGVSKEFLDIVSIIYEAKDNINPYEYLELITKDYNKFNYMAYKKSL